MIVSAYIAGGAESVSGPADALLPWWSFGKTVLAAAVFKLAEQGRLALDAPLDGRPYTLRQLLGHRAGVPDYGGLAEYHAAVARGDKAWPVSELLSRANANRLLFAPGRGWSYSNIGYLFVRREIERATDSELRSALHATVFAPLGIHAFVTRRRDDMQRLAFANLRSYDPNWVYHGLVVGTASDAARFLECAFTTDFLSEASRAAMFDAVPPPSVPADRPFVTPRAATGLMVDPDGPHGLWYGHTGGGPGSVCAVYRFPDLDPSRTVAAFSDDRDEGAIERAVLEIAAA
ncbi:MAG TPA: serine hydrolase domain-containing protein [Rhizomicrobium sp.]|nr:serine hydrolase domain-containing protein [Rhizomicrobium sp.]